MAARAAMTRLQTKGDRMKAAAAAVKSPRTLKSSRNRRASFDDCGLNPSRPASALTLTFCRPIRADM
jgi:hypothetical protein